MDVNKLLEIKGATTKNELKTLHDLAKTVPTNGLIVEVGSYKGRATVWLAEGAKKGNGARVYAIDRYQGLNGVDWLDEYKESIKNWENYIEIVVSDTVMASCKWDRGMIDLMFIDADHSYEGILGDFGAWYKHLKPGGVVAFHDTTPVIKEILRGVPMHGFKGIRKVVTDLIIRSDKFKKVHLVDSMLYATKCEQRTFFDATQSYLILLKMKLRYGGHKIYRLGTKLSPHLKTKIKKLLGIKVREHYKKDKHRTYS